MRLIHKVTPLFQVFDMETSVDFYCNKIGFTLEASYEPYGILYWASLKLGQAELMLNARFEEEERPPEPDLVRRESHKDTELYFECEDVDEVYVHLCEQGVEAIAPKSTHGRKEILITDPDGFCLSFYQGT